MSDPVMPETAPASDECCCQECVADGSVLPILPLPYTDLSPLAESWRSTVEECERKFLAAVGIPRGIDAPDLMAADVVMPLPYRDISPNFSQLLAKVEAQTAAAFLPRKPTVLVLPGGVDEAMARRLLAQADAAEIARSPDIMSAVRDIARSG